MSYFPEDIGLGFDEMVIHARYCTIIDELELWPYVDVIRLFLEGAGFVNSNQHELMLDIEFVATNHELLPDDGGELLSLYIEWLQAIKRIDRETKKQCQNLMINTNFTRQ